MKSRFVTYVAVAGLLVGAAAVAVAAGHAFVGAEKCKMCHKVQFESWTQTGHAKATEHAKASPAPRAFAPDCLKCHATNNDEAMAGVQCEACHGAGADYKAMSTMKDRAKAVAAGLVVPTQETCNACHDGQEHRTAVVLADQLNNKAAIHAFKTPPAS